MKAPELLAERRQPTPPSGPVGPLPHAAVLPPAEKAVAAPPIAEAVLASPGRPLDAAVRAAMETRFGCDFSHVRVHTDGPAAVSARAVHALAYTAGRHIVFGAGRYAPATPVGAQLAAHELTHVVQQSRGGPEVTAPSQVARLEREAEASATRSGPIAVRGAGAPWLARAPDEGASKLRHHGLTPAEIDLLNEVRGRLIPPNQRSTAIVGVLVADDGRRFELKSGGGQGFSSHVEGKAVAKMEELGITKATLLVEKEPCQICDRSVYSQEAGPAEPLRSSRTGRPLVRQTPKINTGLPAGYELTVVDPDSASLYRGVKPTPAPRPPGGGGAGKRVAPAAEGGPSGPGKAGAAAEVGPTPKAAAVPRAAEPAPVPRPAAPEMAAAPKAAPVPEPAAPRPTVAAGKARATTEAGAAARAAARDLAADIRLLRVAKGLTAALHIISFIAALQTLDSFTKMTKNALAGKGFMLTKEIAEAEALASRAAALKREYPAFSQKLTERNMLFFKAAIDPLAAGRAASSISDIDTQLETLKLDLPGQIARIDAARKEAEAKQKAAEAILNDPQASAALAAATFGTAELATLFAAAQDLQRIAGALRSATADLTGVQNQVAEDYIYIHGWFEALFNICRKGGHCTLTEIQIPFVGTSRIHGLPGEE